MKVLFAKLIQINPYLAGCEVREGILFFTVEPIVTILVRAAVLTLMKTLAKPVCAIRAHTLKVSSALSSIIQLSLSHVGLFSAIGLCPYPMQRTLFDCSRTSVLVHLTNPCINSIVPLWQFKFTLEAFGTSRGFKCFSWEHSVVSITNVSSELLSTSELGACDRFTPNQAHENRQKPH